MSNTGQNLGDTKLTKVFVGGLACGTPKEALRKHFDQYGEILEAVIISDKLTGRSKGYGFVTFKEAEAAKKACEDAMPTINGRRANCNLASLGARRHRPPPSSLPPPFNLAPPQGNTVLRSKSPAPANHVQWYYPATRPPVTPFHNQQHHQAVSFYGYYPSYMTYNQKLDHSGRSYMNGYYSQVYQGQPMVGANTLVPMYHCQQSYSTGLPTHVYSPSIAGPVPSVPRMISKPPSMAPTTVCLAVE